jgi:hypothetical protein
MSQHDFNIANQTFPSFRADLNDALQAAATISAGATAPSTPYAYQLWFDTSTNTYKARNAANSAWVSLFGNDLTNAGITFGDNDSAVFGAGNDLTINHDGSNSFITDSGTGSLYIQGTSGVFIRSADGGETLAAFTDDGAATLYYDNAAKVATTATGVDVKNVASGGNAKLNITTESTGGGTSEILFSDNVTGRGRIYYNHGSDPEKLHIETTGTDAIVIDNSQNVGIGTSSPNEKVTINGSFRGASQDWQMQILNPDTAAANKGGGIAFGGSYTGAVQTYFSNILGAKENGTAGNLAGYLSFYTRSSGAGYTAERMRIDSSGQVLIGTTVDHSANLTVDDNGGAKIVLSGRDNSGGDVNKIEFRDRHTGTYPQGQLGSYIYGHRDGTSVEHYLTFGTTNADADATEKMRIDSSGNLLVGTQTKETTGTTLYGSTANGFYIKTTSTCGYLVTQAGVGGAGTFISLYSDTTAVGSITTNGSSTSYNTSSDYRLKTAVEYDWDATTRLKQLKPARFEWIADGDDAVPVDGFLAHEVQDIVPEAISGTKDGMRDEEYEVSAATGDIYTPAVEATYDDDGVELTAAIDEVIHSADVEQPEELAEGQQWRETTAAVMGTRSVPNYQGIDQSKLVPLLVKTIQELEARITALEAS